MLNLTRKGAAVLAFGGLVASSTAWAQTADVVTEAQKLLSARRAAATPIAPARQAELDKSAASIASVEDRLAAFPQDTEQAQAVASGVRLMLDHARRFQELGNAKLARQQAALADRELSISSPKDEDAALTPVKQ